MQPNQQTPKKQRVSINPVAHLIRGVKAVSKTNLGGVLVALFVDGVVGTALSIAFLYGIFLASGSFFRGFGATSSAEGFSGLFRILGIFLVLGILAAIVVGYFASVVNRLILTASRGQKQDIGQAFSFVLGRLPKIIGTYLFIFAIYLGGWAIILLSARISPIVAIILGIAGVLAGIVLLIRILYIPLVLVDDLNTGGAIATIRRSSLLFTKSSWAILIYGLSLIAVYMVAAMVFGNIGSSDPSSINYGNDPFQMITPAKFSFAIGGVIISSFIGSCFGALAYCGQASIYNQALVLLDGPTVQSKVPDGSNPAAAPIAPVA